MGDERREWLLVRAAGLAEDRIDVEASPLRIGRGPDNRIVLRDSYASAHHAELVDRGGERCVRDLGSRNGTRLNGRALAPSTLHALHDGDVIKIGSATLTYRRAPAAGGAMGPPEAPAAARPAQAPTPLDAPRTAAAKDGQSASASAGAPRAPAAGRTGAPADGRGAIRGAPAVGRPAVAREAESPSMIFPAPPPPSRRRWAWFRFARAALWLGLALAVAAGVLAGIAWALAPARVVLLVMGTDARPDELLRGEPGRTDTMLALVADRSPSGVVLISVPRDLWVPIPGFGEERINAAYAVGGADAAERAVGDVLGVPVGRHLLIGLQGVRDIVDAAGGVEIVVDQPIHDDAYPTDDYGTIVLDIPAGRQRMDGETALRYARTRHQDSDFGRMARQQRVMLALRNAMLRPANWWRLPAVFGAVRRATRTDLGLPDLVTLGLVFGVGAAEPERLTLDLELVDEFRGADGAFLLRPRPALRQRVAAVLAPSSAAVEVLNGTSTAGLAMQAADRLRARQLRVVNVGTTGRPHAETTVEVRSGFTRVGANAASIIDLPRDAVRENPALLPGVDVRITLGEDRAGP